MTISRPSLALQESRDALLRKTQLQTRSHTKLAYALLATVIILFVIARFWNLTAYSLWSGETFVMNGVRQNWPDMFAYIIRDVVHPPLFYILLKFWVALGGESLLWLKLFPSLISIAALIPFLLLCRELNLGTAATTLAVAFMSVNGYLVHYSQELRMYVLLMFLAICSYWLFAHNVNTIAGANSRKASLALFVVNLLLVYTHYFGWLVVGTELLFLLLLRRQYLLTFGLSVIGLAILFSPWAFLVAKAASDKGGLDPNLDWIPRPTLSALKYLYFYFNGDFASRVAGNLSLVLFGLPTVLWATQILSSRKQEQQGDTLIFWWLFLMAFFPVAIVFAAGRSALFAQAFWIDRYFIFTAPVYAMLVALSAYRMRPYWLRAAVILLLVIWSVLAGLQDLQTNRIAWESPQVGSRMNWETLANRLVNAEAATDNINVYVLPVISKQLETGSYAISESLDYYLAELGDDRFQFVFKRNATALASVNDDHFWLGYYELEAGERQRTPQSWLEQNGYRTGELIQEVQGNNRLVLLPVWAE